MSVKIMHMHTEELIMALFLTRSVVSKLPNCWPKLWAGPFGLGRGLGEAYHDQGYCRALTKIWTNNGLP